MAETGEPNKQQINQHSTEDVEARVAPAAGNASNEARAQSQAELAAERAEHRKGHHPPAQIDPAIQTSIADKQTGDDPTGAGPTGHGISPGDADKETKEESASLNAGDAPNHGEGPNGAEHV